MIREVPQGVIANEITCGRPNCPQEVLQRPKPALEIQNSRFVKMLQMLLPSRLALSAFVIGMIAALSIQSTASA